MNRIFIGISECDFNLPGKGQYEQFMDKTGFSGGCHWCTEAVFQALKGVDHVEQGWIASRSPFDSFSEGITVHYNDDINLDSS